MASWVEAVEVEVADQSVAFPFGNVGPVAPLHPAIALGAQHAWVDRRVDVVQTGWLGGSLHPTAGNAARLGTDLDLRLRSGVGPLLEVGLSLGADWVVRARPVLGFDEDTGAWSEGAGAGRPAIDFGAGAAIGFDLGDVSRVPLTVLVDYHWAGRTAFLPVLPFGPTATLGVGLRATLGRRGDA